MTKDVFMVVGAGQISLAIARRIGFGKKIILGDKNTKNCENIADGGATASYCYGPLQP